ncbi:radical SAM protein [Bacillus thuringiensis]|uniref:radical SAM protein n=1 Tax=Bacillus thuringiensis TaxID=1428 RepID=UPI000BFBF186|nr:radical SAM protein [Bacillus thuringiensis]PGU18163.1 radical SAM protein [Bacillus thuringiensis]
MKPPKFQYILLKLASRCNLKCTYCYWFKDNTVYDKPAILTKKAEHAFLLKLEKHINSYELKKFTILFHGGEPLLFGKKRFYELCKSINNIEQRTGVPIHLLMTTNGILLDEEWISYILKFKINVTVSIDGPPEIHNQSRIDHMGKGSYNRVKSGLMLLKKNGINPGILSVCNPIEKPDIIVNHFVETLNLKHFDILVPDATHEDHPISIAAYYKRLFDIWYDQYSGNIEIRYIKDIVKTLLGGNPGGEALGYGPITTLTMLTDGSLEPLDVLRIAGNGHTQTNLSILTHTFQDITKDPVWLEAFHASLNLNEQCQKCEYKNACGGGFLPSRWSKEKRYDNPNVYCEDIKRIFEHVWNRIILDLQINVEEIKIPLKEAIKI